MTLISLPQKKRGRLHNKKMGRKKKPVKFSAEFSSSPSGSDLDEERKEGDTGYQRRPPLPARTNSSSGATLVERATLVNATVPAHVELDYEKEIEAVKEKVWLSRTGGVGQGMVDYSDCEEDVTARVRTKAREGEGERDGWKPAFLDRRPYSMPASTPVSAPVVPATPSLIKALDRIALAQRDAFFVQSDPGRRNFGLIHSEETREIQLEGGDRGGGQEGRWDEFWRDVRMTMRQS